MNSNRQKVKQLLRNNCKRIGILLFLTGLIWQIVCIVKGKGHQESSFNLMLLGCACYTTNLVINKKINEKHFNLLVNKAIAETLILYFLINHFNLNCFGEQRMEVVIGLPSIMISIITMLIMNNVNKYLQENGSSTLRRCGIGSDSVILIWLVCVGFLAEMQTVSYLLERFNVMV